MAIDEILYYPKYCGLTIKQVYQGAKDINKDLIVSFLIDRLDTIYRISSPQSLSAVDYNNLILIDTQNFIITKEYIQTTPTSDLYRGDWSRAIEKLFQNKINPQERHAGFMNLNKYNSTVFSKNKLTPERAGGDPYYIKWCIENVPDFFISPDELITLQSLNTYLFMGIKVSFKTSDCF